MVFQYGKEKWADNREFLALSLPMKCFLQYVLDNVDLTGFFFPDWRVVQRHLGPDAPTEPAARDAMAPFLKFWPDRWQVRGYLPWKFPESGKTPNGWGMKAFRGLDRHVLALGAGADLYQAAFEGRPDKHLLYVNASLKKRKRDEKGDAPQGAPHPPPQDAPQGAGGGPFLSLLTEVQPCTAEQGSTEETVPPLEAGLLEMPLPEMVHLPSEALGGGRGGPDAPGADLLAGLALAMVTHPFRVREIQITDQAPWLPAKALAVQDAYGVPLVSKALESYLDAEKPLAKTPRDFLDHADKWIQVANQAGKEKGCQHDFQPFDEPEDPDFPMGVHRQGAQCARCGKRRAEKSYRPLCDHGGTGCPAMSTTQRPTFRAGRQVWVSELKCGLCGDVHDAPGIPQEVVNG